MTTYVAMLRGINVSGHNKVKMADLQALFVALGHSAVTTYIQSGNVVFTSTAKSPSSVAGDIERKMAGDLGVEAKVLIRTAAALAKVIVGNPFLPDATEPSKLHVTFLASEPAPERRRNIEVKGAGPDAFALVSREVYLHCPEGYGRTKLNNMFWERRLGVVATTRNWNTVTTLCQLAEG